MATLVLGLKNLQRQLNVWAPQRVLPDGWIGDPAHQGETSGHNPDDTPGSKPAWNADPDNLAEVRALDVKTSFGNGVSGVQVVSHLRGVPGLSSVVRYMIHNGFMYHSRNGFNPEAYTRGNPHTTHIHFEGAWTQSGDNNTTFNFRLEEIPVALTQGDKDWLTSLVNGAVQTRIDDIAAAVDVRLAADFSALPQKVWDVPRLENAYSGVSQNPGTILRYIPSRAPHDVTQALLADLAALIATTDAGNDAQRAEILSRIAEVRAILESPPA